MYTYIYNTTVYQRLLHTSEAMYSIYIYVYRTNCNLIFSHLCCMSLSSPSGRIYSAVSRICSLFSHENLGQKKKKQKKKTDEEKNLGV